MKKIHTILLVILTFILFTAIKFVAFSEYNTFFFTTIVIDFITLIVGYLLLNYDKKEFDKLYSYSLQQISCSVLLFILCWLNSIIFLAKESNNFLSYFAITLIIYCIIFSYYILVYKAKHFVKKSQNNTQNSMNKWKLYLVKLENADESLINDQEFKELIELFKYSDPINDINTELDTEIFKELDILLLKKEKKLIKTITDKIKERNEIVKITK